MARQMTFEGMPARTIETSFTGKLAMSDKLKIDGQPVYFLVRGFVKGVSHDLEEDGPEALKRLQKVKVTGARRVDSGDGEIADSTIKLAISQLAAEDQESIEGDD